MNLIPEFSININNSWVFSLIYLVVSNGLILLIPKYNISKFIKVPKLKYTNKINLLLYYIFFAITIFVPIQSNSNLLYFSVALFIIGLILYTSSIFYFAISEYHKFVNEGTYKFSRHPVYFSFLIIGISISLSGASILLLIIIILHFISIYFIAKEEERLCLEKYGKEYEEYKKRVRMFI